VKAWVCPDGEGERVVYTDDPATLRGEYGDEMRRAPKFDRYAPDGPSREQLFREHGWWFECDWCDHVVTSDGCDECIAPDGFMAAPVARGEWVWCSVECERAWSADRAQRKAAEDECERRVRAAVAEKFPGATVTRVHTYPPDAGTVWLRLPGGSGDVRWSEVDGHAAAWVESRDLEAFEAWRARGYAPEEPG
jgi:hypothetical protein